MGVRTIREFKTKSLFDRRPSITMENCIWIRWKYRDRNIQEILIWTNPLPERKGRHITTRTMNFYCKIRFLKNPLMQDNNFKFRNHQGIMHLSRNHASIQIQEFLLAHLTFTYFDYAGIANSIIKVGPS